jgi:hypothetical protein
MKQNPALFVVAALFVVIAGACGSDDPADSVVFEPVFAAAFDLAAAAASAAPLEIEMR